MTRTLIALACLLAALPAAAQLYRWVDEKGRVQYSDKPPPGAKARAVEGTAPPEPPKTPAVKPDSKGKIPAPYRGVRSQGDPAAEAREKKKAAEKKAREAQARVDREPACEAAKNALRESERTRFWHEKKGSKKAVEYTNEEQLAEIHKRRRAANAACY